MNAHCPKKKKRFPLSLFVEIAKRVRQPQWKIAERIGHPQWKIAMRKIPTTYH